MKEILIIKLINTVRSGKIVLHKFNVIQAGCYKIKCVRGDKSDVKSDDDDDDDGGFK